MFLLPLRTRASLQSAAFSPPVFTYKEQVDSLLSPLLWSIYTLQFCLFLASLYICSCLAQSDHACSVLAKPVDDLFHAMSALFLSHLPNSMPVSFFSFHLLNLLILHVICSCLSALGSYSKSHIPSILDKCRNKRSTG
ncbi:hypothetical protein ILYODFUR_014273 [Ilyodon furcidens]|uniref:Uncharacterized protein n=1 Tax=Ilyodon furcidens TaxID=33524 RepID=A0ABV0TX87_9TELE